MLYRALGSSVIQKRLPDFLWTFLENRLGRDHAIYEIQRRAAKLARGFNLEEGELLPLELDEGKVNAKITIIESEDINTLYEKIIRTLRKSPNTIEFWEIEYSGRILNHSFIDLLDNFGFPGGKISSANGKHILKFRFSNPYKGSKGSDVKEGDTKGSGRSLVGSLLDSNGRR